MSARALFGCGRSLLLIALVQGCGDSGTGPGPIHSGPPGTFQRVIATGNSESGKFVRETPDGFLVLEARGIVGEHTLIARTTASGDLIAENSLHSSESTYLYDAVAAGDGGVAALIAGGDTLQVFKLDQDGRVQWHTRIAKRQFPSIAQSPGGAFVVVGAAGSEIGVPQSLIVTQVTPSGQQGWETVIESASSYVPDTDVTPSGDIIMTGFNHGMYVARADALGHLTKEVSFPGDGYGHLIAALDEDALIAGAEQDRPLVMRVAPDGTSVWKKSLAVGLIYDVAVAPDGSIAVAGETKSRPPDAFLSRLSGTGQVMWTRTYGREDYDYAFMVRPISDGFVLTGSSNGTASTSFPPTDVDLLLVRTNREGLAAPLHFTRVCPDPAPAPPVPPTPSALNREWRLTHGPVNDSSFYDMDASPGGSVYGVAGYHIYHLQNNEWKIADVKAPDLLFGIAAVEDNYVVATGINHTLFHFDGSVWKSYPSPAPHWSYSVLGSVWGSSRNDIFAAGQGSNQASMIHFNGTSWSQMTIPVAENILGLWGVSPTDVWAATQQGSILHYDGTAWAKVYGSSADFRGVWASSANDVYVCGMNGSLLHFDGTSWTPLNITSANLNGVSGRGANEVYVAGTLGQTTGVLFHFDGNTWTDIASQITSGTPPPIQNVLAASNNRLFASREDFDPRVYWFDGAKWNASAKDEPSLHGVWALSQNDAYAVGEKGTALHWNGTSWESMPTGTSAELRAVFGFSDQDVFVGSRYGAISHFDGTSWTQMDTPASYVHDIWGDAPNDVYASGEILMHYDGNHWSDVTPKKPSSVFSMFGISRSDLYGSDYDGIWHSDGCNWELSREQQGGVWSIWSQPGPLVYAVGDRGLVVRYDGTTWTALDSGDKEFYSAVWGRGSNDIFVVGNTIFGGYFVMRHFDGQTWSSPPRTTSWALNDVFGTEDGAIFAVGNGGVIVTGVPQSTVRVSTASRP